MLRMRSSYSRTYVLSVYRSYRKRKLDRNRHLDIAGKKFNRVDHCRRSYLTVQQGEESSAIGERASVLLLTTSEAEAAYKTNRN